MMPHGEFVRLLDAARQHLSGDRAGVTADEVRTLARRDIRSAVLVEKDLRLDLGDDTVTLTRIVPAGLVLDLLADLLPRPRRADAEARVPW